MLSTQHGLLWHSMAQRGPVYTWQEQGARESVKPLTQGVAQ